MHEGRDYDIEAREWTQARLHPGPSPMKCPTVFMDGDLVLAGGEISAGKRTPFVWRVLADE